MQSDRPISLACGRGDIAQSLLYYLDESPQAALHFEEELEGAVEEILEAPTRYRIDSKGNRAKTLERFPFTIYYQIVADEIRIVSVAHHARMPGYWHGRIQ